MASPYQLQNIGYLCGVVLALCLLPLCAAQSNYQSVPTEHGLTYVKNPAEATPEMIKFFDRPKVELPEAQNIPDPVLNSRTKSTAPADPAHSDGHKQSANLIAVVVLAVLGIGLLATAVVAYMVITRKSKALSSSGSSVSLTHWRCDSDVRMGVV